MLKFLHFSDNIKHPDKNGNNYDRLWKVRTLSDQFIDAYTKFYSPSKHSTLDEVNYALQRESYFHIMFQEPINFLGKDKFY
jgi:hypothetical protein